MVSKEPDRLECLRDRSDLRNEINILKTEFNLEVKSINDKLAFIGNKVTDLYKFRDEVDRELIIELKRAREQKRDFDWKFYLSLIGWVLAVIFFLVGLILKV